MTTPLPDRTVLLYTVEEAADVLRIGRSKLFDLIRCNELESVKIGRLRRVPEDAVREYLRRLRAQRECA